MHHLIPAIFVVDREWDNLAIVSAWPLVLRTSLLCRQRCIVVSQLYIDYSNTGYSEQVCRHTQPQSPISLTRARWGCLNQPSSIHIPHLFSNPYADAKRDQSQLGGSIASMLIAQFESTRHPGVSSLMGRSSNYLCKWQKNTLVLPFHQPGGEKMPSFKHKYKVISVTWTSWTSDRMLKCCNTIKISTFITRSMD